MNEGWGTGEDVKSKVKTLTKVGLYGATDKTYLKYYRKERDSDRTDSHIEDQLVNDIFHWNISISEAIEVHKFFWRE